MKAVCLPFTTPLSLRAALGELLPGPGLLQRLRDVGDLGRLEGVLAVEDRGGVDLVRYAVRLAVVDDRLPQAGLELVDPGLVEGAGDVEQHTLAGVLADVDVGHPEQVRRVARLEPRVQVGLDAVVRDGVGLDRDVRVGLGEGLDQRVEGRLLGVAGPVDEGQRGRPAAALPVVRSARRTAGSARRTHSGSRRPPGCAPPSSSSRRVSPMIALPYVSDTSPACYSVYSVSSDAGKLRLAGHGRAQCARVMVSASDAPVGRGSARTSA